ncbi:MAG TPA: hypothetical protein ENG45_00650 [Candidatus Aenigmarchaeota archaeon]|nr:hypothetical protein [Candidatus Aenigmarchaeota archaeon]
MRTKGVTVYTIFLVVLILSSLFFLILVLIKFMKSPETKGMCEVKVKSFCLEWYSNGYLPEKKPKGYDFSSCEKYGISEPTKDECERLIG